MLAQTHLGVVVSTKLTRIRIMKRYIAIGSLACMILSISCEYSLRKKYSFSIEFTITHILLSAAVGGMAGVICYCIERKM